MIRPTKPRIFIECTHTFFYGGNGGIQRVVRNIANHSSNIKITEAEVNPIIWVGLGFCKPKVKIKVKPYFLISIKKRIRQLLYFKSKKKSSWLKVNFIRELLYFLMGLGYIPTQLLFGRFVSFRHGDIIVLIDSTWRSNAMLNALFKSQYHHGVTLGVMIHDLFPLLLPDTCDEITARGFVDWFNKIVPRVNFIVTNSEATRLSLRQYMDENPQLRQHPYASGAFRLGAELDLANERKKTSWYIQPLWDTPGKVMLSIGTIEPRKNHAYILDAFDILNWRNS